MWSPKLAALRAGTAIMALAAMGATSFRVTQAAALRQEAPTQPSAGSSEGQPPSGKTAPVEPGDVQPGDVQEVQPVPDAIELTEGFGFSYESAGRRDPFISLALGIDVAALDARPQGLQGNAHSGSHSQGHRQNPGRLHRDDSGNR